MRHMKFQRGRRSKPAARQTSVTMSDSLEETASYKIDRFFKTMENEHDAALPSDLTHASRDTVDCSGERHKRSTAAMATLTENDDTDDVNASNLYEELLAKQNSRRALREVDHATGQANGASVRPSNSSTPNGGGPALMPAPLITKRTTPLMSRSSSAARTESNGHATPVVGDRRPSESRTSPSRGSHDFQEALRVDELAAKVETLTKVLGEREAENVSLTTKLDALTEENENLRRQMSAGSYSGSQCDGDGRRLQQKLEDLMAEKEILSQELTEAHSKIEELSHDREQARTSKPLNSSIEFDPNNPATLRRKVEDLETQIQDLQEANESTAILLASYKPLQMEQPERMGTAEMGRSRLPNSEADSLRSEIERLRADLMAMRSRHDSSVSEAERGRAHEAAARSSVGELHRYERERSSVLEEMQRLRQDLREEQNRSGRLSGSQLRSQSYANLTSYENERRSPFVETFLSTDGDRRSRKTSGGLESHQRSNSSSRIKAPPVDPREPPPAAKDERTDANSSGSTASILSDADRELEDMKMMVARSFTRPGPDTADQGATLRRSVKSPLPSAPAGLRTVSPPPIPTQHNRTNLMKSGYNPDADRESAFATISRHPFAPRNAADIQLRDIVKFTRQGGRICKGLVHFVGHLPGRNDVYIGVELEHEDGKHDGTYEGRRYFQCKTNKGVFVAFNKVIMCYGLRPV